MRGRAENAREESQEVKGAEPDLCRRTLEVDWLVRVLVDPQRRFHRAPAIARRSFRWFSLPPRGHFDETGCEQHSHLVDTDVAPAFGGRLCELAEHHQLGQWRY